MKEGEPIEERRCLLGALQHCQEGQLPRSRVMVNELLQLLFDFRVWERSDSKLEMTKTARSLWPAVALEAPHKRSHGGALLA